MSGSGSSSTVRPSARELVERYLAACERRDLATADALLAAGAVLEFPGGRRYSSVREMVAQAAHRYRQVGKHMDQWRCATLSGGHEIVVCIGTLFGVGLRGAPFAGVRFVDLFEVAGGMIVSQRVWNDLAENGIVAPGCHSDA